MAYKFNIRDASNTSWINLLQAQFVEVLDSNGKFTATTVETVLEELFDTKAEHVESTVAPTATDDGYNVGTIWTDTVTDTPYILADNATGSAVWVNAAAMSDEQIQDIVGQMITNGTQSNISVTYDDPNGAINYSVDTATDTVLGVASFDNTNFVVNTGNVTIAANGVSATELASNIDMSTRGFNADQVDGTDVNDSGITTSDLWTASKIKTYVDSIASGLAWQEPVIDKDLDTPPASPATGDRYITSSSPTVATGDWTGHDNEIAEWDGSAWDFTSVVEGMATWVQDEDVQYVYNGTAWAKLGTTLTHSNLLGLQGGNGGSELYHLTSAEHSSITGSKSANTVFASPNGSAGVGGFRSLVSDDIPTLTHTKIGDWDTSVVTVVSNMLNSATTQNISVSDDGSGSSSYIVATATTTTLGVASFDSSTFTVTNGNVSLLASGVDHGGLAGLADDDHTQYVHISTARTISAVHTFSPSSTSAPFILGSNAQGELVTGLNADLLNGQDWSVAATASAPASPAANDVWLEITA